MVAESVRSGRDRHLQQDPDEVDDAGQIPRRIAGVEFGIADQHLRAPVAVGVSSRADEIPERPEVRWLVADDLETTLVAGFSRFVLDLVQEDI